MGTSEDHDEHRIPTRNRVISIARFLVVSRDFDCNMLCVQVQVKSVGCKLNSVFHQILSSSSSSVPSPNFFFSIELRLNKLKFRNPESTNIAHRMCSIIKFQMKLKTLTVR